MPAKKNHGRKRRKPVKDLSNSKIIDLDVVIEANNQVRHKLDIYIRDSGTVSSFSGHSL